MNRNSSIILFLILIFVSFKSYSQQPADTLQYRIETNDGNEYIGSILEQDTAVIVFKTKNLGQIVIRKPDIKNIQLLEGSKIVKGKYWLLNPQSTRYFWAPNGYGLNRGEAYYQNVWVFFNQFVVGVTPNVSLGAGFMPLFLLGGGPTPVWFTPKVSFPVVRDKFNLGGGALIGTVLSEDNAGFGIVYGTSTFGNRDANFSLGMGYGYADKEWTRGPVVNFSVMLRGGANGYFLSENYYLPTGGSSTLLFSLGGRFIIRRAGLDFGLFLPINSDMDTFVAIPWLGLTFPFGNTAKLQQSD